jgi:hypothetical protein
MYVREIIAKSYMSLQLIPVPGGAHNFAHIHVHVLIDFFKIKPLFEKDWSFAMNGFIRNPEIIIGHRRPG